jgi:hypothetical protein
MRRLKSFSGGGVDRRWFWFRAWRRRRRAIDRRLSGALGHDHAHEPGERVFDSAALVMLHGDGEENANGQLDEQRDVTILRSLPGVGRIVLATPPEP